MKKRRRNKEKQKKRRHESKKNRRHREQKNRLTEEDNTTRQNKLGNNEKQNMRKEGTATIIKE